MSRSATTDREDGERQTAGWTPARTIASPTKDPDAGERGETRLEQDRREHDGVSRTPEAPEPPRARVGVQKPPGMYFAFGITSLTSTKYRSGPMNDRMRIRIHPSTKTRV